MQQAYAEMIAELSATKKVLVTTHVRPDGDALGSTAAMVLGLKHKGIAADVLLLSHLPTKYAFVYREADIAWMDAEAGFPADFSLAGYDALLVIDTGTWSQLPGLKPYVEAFTGRKLVIDHHLTQEDWADRKLVVTAAGAAGEIIGELLEQWQVPMSRAIAESLYTALVSDTGWFQYSNTRPFTLRLAAQLLEAGVDADRLYQRLYQNERPERVLLQARAMQSLELLENSRVSLILISRDDLAATNATTNDTEGLINLPLQVKSVAVSVLLSDPPEGGAIRCSFRSKGQMDCSAFAQQFGGGGHARAAGAKIPGTLAEVRERIVAALAVAFSAMS
ncbi:MAG: exopolyphosphatase-like enzyme [Phycisphaerales bacterium]|nr:exopolyphosphatase-like enzyme [Phycisphaerales bacterium]